MIAISFMPLALSLMIPTYFQAIGKGSPSIFLTVLRQIILLVPLAWVLSLGGLRYVWWAFPITEVITASAGLWLYKKYPM